MDKEGLYTILGVILIPTGIVLGGVTLIAAAKKWGEILGLW